MREYILVRHNIDVAQNTTFEELLSRVNVYLCLETAFTIVIMFSITKKYQNNIQYGGPCSAAIKQTFSKMKEFNKSCVIVCLGDY